MMTKAKGVRTTGEEFAFEASISKTESGGKRFFTIILRDITERKHAEDALAPERRTVQAPCDAASRTGVDDGSDAAFYVDPGRRFHGDRSRSSSARRLAVQEFFNTDDPLYAPIAAHRRALLGESVNYEMTIAGHTFEAHVEALRDSHTAIIGTLGAAFDITERKRAEEELQRERNLLRTIIEAIPMKCM